MAYVNVADWKPDQVADWLKGLDISIHRYVESFLNNHVNGQHLLNLQPDDLEHHGIFKVGHQEIILEAVDHLRNFHYELDHENLQLLALRVSCLAHSLHRELWNSSPAVSTQTLSDIASILKVVKLLVCWLDRPPFSGQLAYIDKKAEILRLGLEMATSGQRDRFVDRPIDLIITSSKRLAELADEMIREIHDPLLLQPASLDLATLKKRPGDHLGFCIIPSFHGNHQIGEIKCNSTAYQSGKIECGDEIVQINYQTVVGWEVKQVMALFEESSSDIFLTLKKRPCHSKILGQIYMKPYRLPSKKQVSYASKWFLGDNISPPRINIGGHFDLKPLNNQLNSSVSTSSKNKKDLSNSNASSKEDMTEENTDDKIIEKEEDDDNEQEEEEESISSPTSVRLYYSKPRLPVQRRATITGTGASPTSKRAPLNLEQLWHELKLEREWRLSGKQRKSDKSNSEILLPTTLPSDNVGGESKISLKSTKASSADCLKSVQSDFSPEHKLGIASTHLKPNITEHEALSESEVKESSIEAPRYPPDADPEIKFIPLKERIDIFNKNIDSKNTNPGKPIIPAKKIVLHDGFSSLTNSPLHKPSDKKPIARPRGKLDKSNSTPVYDSQRSIDLFLTENKTRCASSTQKEPIVEKTVPSSKNDLITKNTSGTPLSPVNKANDSVPVPAARTSTRNISKTSDDGSPPPAPLKIGSTELHISESEDSVFLGDGDVESNSNQKTKSIVFIKRKDDHTGQSLPSPPEQQVKPPNALRDIVILQKMKYIDDPESPTYPLPGLPDFKSRLPLHELKRQSPNLDNLDALNSFNFSASSNLGQHSIMTLPESSKANEIIAHENSELIKEPLPSTQTIPKNPVSKSSSPTPGDLSPVDESRKPPITTISTSSLSTSSSTETIHKTHFACSTPIKKYFPEPPSSSSPSHQQPSTYPRKKPEIKPAQAGPSSSISQNSSLRAIIPTKSKNKPTSPKVFRKKNNILKGKRRNTGVKDLVLPDCEGWLFQRDRKISAVPQWVRGWFVIKGNNFYGFSDKDSTKAHLFIYLPGFTVSPASEVKSRKYALKIYHTGTTFYLAADSQDEFSSWLSCLSQAVIAHDRSPVEDIAFSESEGEEKPDPKEDAEKSKGDHCPKVKKMSTFFTGPLSSKSDKKCSSLKRSKKTDPSLVEHGNSSLDRKYLRFLSGSNNVPVPTARFRSYRRIPPGNMNDSSFSVQEASATCNDSPGNRTSPLHLPPDMADYRLAFQAKAGHTLSRQREHNTTLEAFMISRQGEERRQSQQNVSALRPPQQFAPSAPLLNSEAEVCRPEISRHLNFPSTSQKGTDCRVNVTTNCDWNESFHPGSSRNCNTIPDIQTKRFKKMANAPQAGNFADISSLSEVETSSERNQFLRNSNKSSSSSRLKSLFSTSHWQDSSSKGLLGSPRLRRVLFREKSDANNTSARKANSSNNPVCENINPMETGQHTPDYPGLEYPPVFVPESYSLSYVTSILEARSNNSSTSNHENEPNGSDPNEQP